MVKYLQIALAAVLFLPSSLEGQLNVAIQKKDFRTDLSGFEAAWKNISDGDNYYAGKGIWYGYAFEEYRKALAYNNSNPQLNYKTGASALFSDRKDEAAFYLLKAYELKNDVADDILLLAGRALQYSGKFPEAVGKLEQYLGSATKKTKSDVAMAEKYIEECNSAMIVTKDTMLVSISNLGPDINSNSDDYSAVVSADGNTLFFASRREMFKKSNNSYPDSKFDENIFISSNNNGKWEPATTTGRKLTTPLCEAPLYVNAAVDRLYIYSGYENGGDIRVSQRKKGVWGKPRNISYRINTGGAESSFTYSPAGDEIWFVSDGRKKSIGGKDIYFIRRLNDRKWSAPQNAGPSVNTPFDEESVRFSVDGDTLWFSSKGHNSIGGFDIFYSVRDPFGEWGKALNAGYPLNTPWDDLFYYPSPVAPGSFYFVSNRSGGLGGLDLYSGSCLPHEVEIVTVMEEYQAPEPDTVIIRDTVVIVREVIVPAEPAEVPKPEDQGIWLTGKITDSETGEPVLAKIDILDISTNEIAVTTASSDIDGSYRLRLPAKQSWIVDIKSPGFLSDMKRINIPGVYASDDYNFSTSLIRVKVGKKVVLRNILFETGKAILTASSYEELNRLYEILQENPLMRIEISGHTDNTGSLALNLKLSEERARAVVEYLVQKGTERERLEFKGFGPGQPVADNSTAAGRTQNRRVEFKILEF